MRNEPIVTVATITAAAAAVIGLLVAFAVPITEEQQTAILGVVAVLAPILVALATRSQVTPNARVVEREDSGKVVAGEGSELPTGQVIRDAGSLDVVEGGE